VTGPLKWLLGGPGLAYLYVRDEWLRRLEPTITGWFAARDQFAFDIHHFAFKDDARRFELGTPALPTVHSALGGQDIIDEIGVAAIRERNSELTEHLVQRLARPACTVRGAADPAPLRARHGRHPEPRRPCSARRPRHHRRRAPGIRKGVAPLLQHLRRGRPFVEVLRTARA
jgi:selenocysteine lyase/cysteine desulfurase